MTKADKLLIAIILLSSVLTMVFLNLFVYSATPKAVAVDVDGKSYARYLFSEIKDIKIVNIETDLGVNVLEIHKDKVRIIDASCPDKLDVHQGYINRTGHVLVCLPNKLVVRIEGEKLNVDAVTY